MCQHSGPTRESTEVPSIDRGSLSELGFAPLLCTPSPAALALRTVWGRGVSPQFHQLREFLRDILQDISPSIRHGSQEDRAQYSFRNIKCRL